MKIVTIGDAENVILGLQDEIRRSEESRYDHRLHGVLLVAHGMNCCQVADILGDAPRTVAYWVERFEQKGLGGLHEGSRSGRPSKLNADQIADLQRVLRGKPSEVGLSGNLWDGKTMSAYLRSKHRVQLGPRQCRRLLREWEFRYRKPRPVIARSDPLKQAAHKKTPPPAATPLTRVTKFHLIKADADDRPVILLNLTLCIHQRHGARHVFALIENFDAPAPSHLLATADLAQI
jgi:transposase